MDTLVKKFGSLGELHEKQVEKLAAITSWIKKGRLKRKR